MLEQQRFKHFADNVALIGVKFRNRFKMATKVVIGAELGFVEEKHICTHAKGLNQFTQNVESRLRSARFIATELGKVNTNSSGESLLTESSLFAK